MWKYWLNERPEMATSYRESQIVEFGSEVTLHFKKSNFQIETYYSSQGRSQDFVWGGGGQRGGNRKFVLNFEKKFAKNSKIFNKFPINFKKYSQII